MRKVNLIILGFFLFVGLLVVGVKILVQSERFAKIVSEQMTKNVFQKFNSSLQFSHLEIQLLPPGAVFHDVSIVTKNSEPAIDIVGRLKRLEFDFGLVDIFSNRLVIRNIDADEGSFLAKGKATQAFWTGVNRLDKNNQDHKDYKLSEFFQIYLDQIFSKLPIQIERINFKKTYIQVEESSLMLNRLFVFLSKGSVRTRFQISDLSLKDYKNYKLFGDIPSFSFDIFMTAKKAKIQNTELKWRDQSVTLDLAVKENEQELLLDGKINSENDLETLWPFVPESIRGKDKVSGKFSSMLLLKGTVKNPEVLGTVKAQNILTPWVNADHLITEVRFHNQELRVNHLKMEHDGGAAEFKRGLDLWSFKRHDFIEHEAYVAVQSLHTNSALRVSSPDLDILKARATGNLVISWNEKTQDVFFHILPGAVVENFSLIDEKSKQAILKNPRLVLGKSSFQLNKKLDVLLDLDVSFPNSHVIAKGILAENDLDIQIENADVDFKAFGPIVGVALEGQAKVDLHISGIYDDVQFDFDVDAKKFGLEGFLFGDVKGEVGFFLKDTSLVLNSLQGQQGETVYKGQGTIAFEKKNPMNIDVMIEKGRYQDLRLILAPLFKSLTFFPEKDLAFMFSGPWKIQGDFDTAKLSIEGDVKANEVQLFREDFDRVDTHLTFKDNALNCSGIKVQKGPAVLLGKLNYDVGSDFLEYEASLKKMKTQDLIYYRALNLGYAAEIQGEFYGSGTLDDFSSKAYVNLTKGYVNNIAVADSVLNVYSNGTDLFAKGHFLGDFFTFDSYFNFASKPNNKSSYFNGRLIAPDAKILWGLISQSNTSDFSLRGNLDAEVKTTFSTQSWNDFDLLLEFNDFWLNRKDFNLSVVPGKNRIIVQDGVIGAWDMQFVGKDSSIRSLGEGSFVSKVRLQNIFDVNASVLEILSDRIQKFSGKVKGRSVVVGEQQKFSHYAEVSGDKLMLKIADVPSVFEDIQLGLVLNDDRLLIRDLEGHYAKGDFDITGNVKLQVPYPLMDLNLSFKNSYVPLFKKSYVSASGKMRLDGNSLPYRLKGNLILHQADLLDEFSDMAGKGGDSTIQTRFIPKGKNSTPLDYINLDLDWEIVRPVFIKNSMAEIKIEGKGTVKGNNSSPSMGGELSLIPGESKIFFKGHEFVINEGKISFNDNLLKNQAELRILGQADINQYRIKVMVSGKSDNVAINLSSDPFLSQEDILSLLAIGVTSDISRGLGETGRRSMTSLGLGTLIMDQMKLNQGLPSDLGVRVSVIPEFSEDESAMMVGRAEGSGASASRVKSTTKIKLQKKVFNKVDVSVSSTLGGTMEQKQEMNINYNFYKNMILQGVYEVKSSDGTENSTNQVSAGADIKFKWSFK